MGMNQDNHDLFDAVNAGVKWMWKTQAECRADASKYGMSNPDYLVPPPENPRIGVDRDAQGQRDRARVRMQ